MFDVMKSTPVKIEVTPEMIRAGLRVLRASGRLYSEAVGPDEELVWSILRAAVGSINKTSRTNEGS